MQKGFERIMSPQSRRRATSANSMRDSRPQELRPEDTIPRSHTAGSRRRQTKLFISNLVSISLLPTNLENDTVCSLHPVSSFGQDRAPCAPNQHLSGVPFLSRPPTNSPWHDFRITRSRCWPLNRRTLERMASFRGIVDHFLAFFPFSRAFRGRSPRVPASTTVR